MTAQRATLFLRIRDFLTSYVTFSDERFADICALWAMGTHVYDRFDSFGYLAITAATKRAGKSVLAELLSMVSHASKMGTGMTAAVMRTYVAEGKTIFFDESEALNSEAASAIRQYLNIGYRKGQMVPVRVSIDETREFPAYGPKCFVLIGDPNDTLRDRAITIEMVRAKAPRVYRYTEAQATAQYIQGAVDPDNGNSDLTHQIDDEYNGELFDAFDVELLQGREGEVWTPILSLAKQFCPDRFNDVLACATQLSMIKQTTEKRTFSEIRKTAEGAATDDTFTRAAMRDLMAIFRKKEDRLFTAEVIERMHAIPTSGWSVYRGEGLNPDLLFNLVKVFGLGTKSIRVGGKVRRGFYRKDVEAAFKKMGDHQ